METRPDAGAVQAVMSTPTRKSVFLSAARYLAGKALTVLVTIFLAVFITMLVVDIPVDVGEGTEMSPFQMRLENQIQWVVDVSIYRGLISTDAYGAPNPREVNAFVKEMRTEAGLDLPFLQRYLLWTYKALFFDWGKLDQEYLAQIDPESESQPNIILQHLPNTLLLVGTAYLLVLLIGMPFALYLARHYGGWLDRFMSVLSPISSVPSWVFAMLLVAVFAVQLRWFPVTGMFDFIRPTEPIPYVLSLLKHMVLPVAALVLSLLFQLVYTWRTFFIIYSEEDYVELARAKGLNSRLLEQRYILKPALPYILTSFTTSLIGFWQLTIALERVFSWPGIGYLYLDVLPDFHGERMEIGDLMIVVQIVVTFAYLLGSLAILLDLAYAVLDPRIHLIPASQTAPNAQVKTGQTPWTRLMAWLNTKATRRTRPSVRPAARAAFSFRQFVSNLRVSAREFRGHVGFFYEQLRLYPSAIFGFTVILLLMAGSLYALIALPYEEIGTEYREGRVSGQNFRPRTAAPAWVNLFSATPHFSTLIQDENNPEVAVATETLENGWMQKTVTYEFDYRYKEIPSDLFIYLDPQYEEKLPFTSLEWITPDGRTIHLKSKAMGGDLDYDMETGIDVTRLLIENPEWKDWFVTRGQYPTPAYQVLFAKPGADEPVPQHGTYRLRITTLLFENESDVQSQLVVLGQVYGLAGTDYWRRDLVVPLLWGMPLSLTIGFIGTFITTLIAMLLPAIGVWFGGWLDTLIQRVTEINMVLPGLAIAALVYALLGVHIWVILAIVVVLNALGAPIKSFRSAFLQAKEAPYIEMARSYGASDFRIITRYLVPRILPVLIPYLVMQIPTFIFLEATLGFFNIQSVYPSWGRIIYEALTQGAIYGSPFWVLEPIFLLLLTGLAFAMLGLALERILNPRVISDVQAASAKQKAKREEEESRGRALSRSRVNWKLAAGLVAALIATAIFIPTGEGRTLASVLMRYFDLTSQPSGRITPATNTPQASNPVSEISFTSTPLVPTSSPATPTPTLLPAVSTAYISCPPANPATPARVLEIVDGNTIRVLIDGLVYVVRYLGVDAPLNDEHAFDSYLKNSDLVFRKDVVLIADGPDKDSSGRLLRYVFVDETFVNQQLLHEGLGLAVGVPGDFACAAAFKAAENTARQSALGIWAAPTPVPTP